MVSLYKQIIESYPSLDPSIVTATQTVARSKPYDRVYPKNPSKPNDSGGASAITGLNAGALVAFSWHG